MTAAADYSFNKSHAACYALISYRTAYLKANYPAEYMAAVISSVMSTKDKVPFFVNKCAEMEIEVLPPDVNSSDHSFIVSGNSIRFGLDAVKNVGHAAVETIIASRSGRRPVRVDLGLLRARRLPRRQQARDRVPDQVRGAGLDRRLRAAACSRCSPTLRRPGRRRRRTPAAGRARSSTLAMTPDAEQSTASPFAAPRHRAVPAEEFDQREKLTLEKETLGTFVSAHPLAEVREALQRTGRAAALGGRGHGRRRLGDGRRDRRRGEEGAHPSRRLRDVRVPRRPRGPARPLRPRCRVGAGRGARRRPGRRRPRAGSRRGRRASSASTFTRPSPSSPGADELAKARAAAAQADGPLVLSGRRRRVRRRARRGAEDGVRELPRGERGRCW